MRLPDNYFKDKSPADIVAKVGTINLANISLLGAEELQRIGWLNNPIVDLLYILNSSGVWVTKVNAAGYSIDATLMGTYFDNHSTLNQHSYISSIPPSSVSGSYRRRIAVKEFVLTNGVYTDGELVAALASYYGVMKILGVYCSAAVDGNDMTLAFEDSDNNDLNGAPPSITAVVLPTAFTAALEGLIMYGGADNKALEVDIDTGGGVADNGKIIYIAFEYWYET